MPGSMTARCSPIDHLHSRNRLPRIRHGAEGYEFLFGNRIEYHTVAGGEKERLGASGIVGLHRRSAERVPPARKLHRREYGCLLSSDGNAAGGNALARIDAPACMKS